MPADSPLVGQEDLAPLVLRLIAETLVIPAERVTLATLLVEDLGAESIDFLDLAFRIGATVLEFAELVRNETAAAQGVRAV
jgi:hypothetical protein